MKKYLIALVVVFVSVAFASAADAKKKKEEEVYTPNFSYSVPTEATPGSGGAVFAIASSNPKTDKMAQWSAYPQFANLTDTSKSDILKILTAKGFTVRGPYDSYDLIPYSDKKAIDLYLIPSLEFSVNSKNHKAQQVGMFSVQFQYTGNAEITGNVVLELKEIVTGELMWRKTIPLKPFEVTYSVRAPTAFDLKYIMNDICKGIELQYSDIMGTIWNLIDPEEMQILKKQAQGLKSKRGY